MSGVFVIIAVYAETAAPMTGVQDDVIISRTRSPAR